MPSPRRALPPAAIINLWLSYDDMSGDFTWIKEPKKIGSVLGKIAGTKRNGYVAIGIPGFYQVSAQNLAWIIRRGPIPKDWEVDHRDGNPSNNALSNLRLATSSQQKQNKRVQSNNASGLKGAFYHACHAGKKWRSQIKVGDKLIYLGYFDTAEEAHAAYTQAAARHFGEFARSQ